MAAKKGGAVALQQDVTTDEEWQSLLKRPGLLLVDVYSEWCGPCVGMVGNLKKIKVEIGGDMLVLATARADNISALERHRSHSEPIWMVIAGGQLINLIFGANAPRIARLIATELENEVKVQKGQTTRSFMPWDALTPEEEARIKAAEEKRLKALAEEEERLAASLNQMRRDNYSKLAEKLLRHTVVLFLPHAVAEGRAAEALGGLTEHWADIGLEVPKDVSLTVTPEMLSEIFFERKLPQHDGLVASLEAGPCRALLLYKRPLEVETAADSDPAEEGDPTSATLEREISATKEEEEAVEKEVVCPASPTSAVAPAAAEAALTSSTDAPEVTEPLRAAPIFDQLESGEVEALVANTLYGFCPSVSAAPVENGDGGAQVGSTDGGSVVGESPAPGGGKAGRGGDASGSSGSASSWTRSEIQPAVDSAAARCLRPRAEGEGPALPGLWTPLSPLSKAAAIQALFPDDVKTLTTPPAPRSLLPPSLVFVWEAARAKEVIAVLTTAPEGSVTGRGFFSETLERVAADEAEYGERLAEGGGAVDGDVYVVAVDSEAGQAGALVEALRGLPADLQPCHMSADREAGVADCGRYFPVPANPPASPQSLPAAEPAAPAPDHEPV